MPTVLLIGRSGERFPPLEVPTLIPEIVKPVYTPPSWQELKETPEGAPDRPVNVERRTFRRVGPNWDYRLRKWVTIYKEE